MDLFQFIRIIERLLYWYLNIKLPIKFVSLNIYNLRISHLIKKKIFIEHIKHLFYFLYSTHYWFLPAVGTSVRCRNLNDIRTKRSYKPKLCNAIQTYLLVRNNCMKIWIMLRGIKIMIQVKHDNGLTLRLITYSVSVKTFNQN